MDEGELIETLAGKFETWLDLKEYADRQYRTIILLQQKLAEKDEEISHLKQLLDSRVERLEVTSAETIAEIELGRLRDRVTAGEILEIDELKRYDILVKGLYTAKGKKNAAIPATAREIPAVVTEQQLLEAAGSPEQPESIDEADYIQ